MEHDLAKELIINSCKSIIDRYSLEVGRCESSDGTCMFIHSKYDPTYKTHLLCAEENNGIVTVRKIYNKKEYQYKHKINLLDPNCNCFEEMGRLLDESLENYFMDLARTEYFRMCAQGECGERGDDV